MQFSVTQQIVAWLGFTFFVILLGIAIFDLHADLKRLHDWITNRPPSSVDQSIKMMYVDQRRDRTAPDAEYGAVRNTSQHRGR